MILYTYIHYNQYIYIYIYIHIYIHICIYTYIYIYIHNHIYIYTLFIPIYITQCLHVWHDTSVLTSPMRWLPSTWFFATRLADARKGTDQDDTGNLSSVDQRGIKTGTLKSAPKKNNIVLIIITFSVLIIMKSSYHQNIKSYIYIYIYHSTWLYDMYVL